MLNNDYSIVSPKGFYASTTKANIKYENRDDMALIFTEKPATCAATFTKNKYKAAPVMWDESILMNKNKISAIVINAGIANAATGMNGFKDVEEIAEYTALKLTKNNMFNADKTYEKFSILSSSTGVIGHRLPMDKMKIGIDSLISTLSNDIKVGHLVSKAIMTTDTIVKEASSSISINNKNVIISGICKGSGMIHPNMGTMLSFVTSDIDIDENLLNEIVKEIADDTYNMISVDGDTSTNDSFIVLTNGMAENDKIISKDENYEKFKNALFEINKELARKIALDGEGATKLMEVIINNVSTKDDAKKIAKSIVSSNLTKAAIYGKDPNWGRIVCAIGNSNADFKIDKVNISFESENGNILVCKNGSNVDFDISAAKKILSTDHIKIICNMNDGSFNATAYGCDLTHKYIDINASYSS